MMLTSEDAMTRGRPLCWWLALPMLMGWGALAAETGGSPRIEEILVTAQKRSESLQDVPIAVSAVAGEVLRERQVTSVEELGSVVPNMDFGTFSGQARMAIRGIGFDAINPGAEGRVAYHLDGVYVSRPGAQLGTFMDVERVEVLRGPQGTLYGRNATGGSVNVVSNKPSDTMQGYVRASYGNHQRTYTEAAIGGPLGDGIAGRVAGLYGKRDGYGESYVTGADVDDQEAYGGRASLRFEPNDVFSLTLSADYYEEDDHNYIVHYFGQYRDDLPLFATAFLGGTVSTDDRDVNTDTTPINKREIYGFAADAVLDFDAFSLRSVTAYRSSDYETSSDYDHTEVLGVIIDFREDADQFSQELQLSGSLGVNEWLLGAYYFEEDIYAFSHLPTDLAIIGLPPFFADAYKAAGDIHTEAWAVFGQFDWQLTEQLTLVLGARYSDEKVTIEDAYQLAFFVPFTPDTGPRDPGPPQPPQAYLERRDSASNDAFTPRAVVEFRPARDVMLYGSISRGFKSGGFTLANPLPAFKPEDLWAYELGAKSTLWEGRLRANAAMFYYDYSNLQVSKVQGRTIVVENAASAELYGVELEFTLLATPHLQIDGAASYLHSEYEDFESQDPGDFDPFDPSYVPPSRDLSGNQLYQAPNYTANVGVEYDWRIGSGSLVARGEMNYVSRNYYTAFNADILSEAANTRFNAFLSYVGGNQRWSATLYARNITDEVTKANALMGAIDYGGPAVGVLTPPRTYGVQIGFQL